MARQDKQANSSGRNSEQQGKSAGSRGTPGDYSDPNARQGSGRSSQGLGSDRNQMANDDDDDDQTYGRQAYQADAGGSSSQGGSESRSLNSQGRSQRDDD